MIRKATETDVQAVVALIAGDPDHLLPRRAAEVADLLDTTWVSEEAGRVVGCCVLEVYSAKIAEIRSCVVHPDYRRRGIGRALVSSAVVEGRRRKIGEILVVTSAREYFERLGFGACLNERFALFWGGE